MPTRRENIDFINKIKFMQQSGINNILLNFMFNASFVFSNADDKQTTNNSPLLKFISDDVGNNIDVASFLKWNIGSFRLPRLQVETTTRYFMNSRRNVVYKDNSDNLVLTFFDTAELKLRRVLKSWKDACLPENGLYPNEYGLDSLNIYPMNGKFETTEGSEESYHMVYPVYIDDVTLDFAADPSINVISVGFNYKRINKKQNKI